MAIEIKEKIMPFHEWNDFINHEIDLIIEDLKKWKSRAYSTIQEILDEYCSIMLNKLETIQKELNTDFEKINKNIVLTSFNAITGVHYDLRVNIRDIDKTTIIFISNISGKVTLLEKMVRFFFEGKIEELEKKVNYVEGG